MPNEAELEKTIQEMTQKAAQDSALVAQLTGGLKKSRALLEQLQTRNANLDNEFHRVLFYTRNWKKFEQVESLLADEKSKKVLRNLFLRVTVSDKQMERELLEEIVEDSADTSKGARVYYSDGSSVPLKIDPNQYFPKELVSLGPDEVFLDVGGFDGETTIDFITRANGRFKAVHTLEPSRTNFTAMRENVHRHFGQDERIHLHNYGLSSTRQTLHFDKESASTATGLAQPTANTEACEVRPIDEILTEQECNSITFIKMDVEGAEMDGLQSLAKYIKKNTPLLALSVYHKLEDIWEIPLFIYSLAPTYRFYLRQHTSWYGETVLYALPARP